MSLYSNLFMSISLLMLCTEKFFFIALFEISYKFINIYVSI